MRRKGYWCNSLSLVKLYWEFQKKTQPSTYPLIFKEKFASEGEIDKKLNYVLVYSFYGAR